MKSYKFKIGKRELILDAPNYQCAFELAEAFKLHYNWYGKIYLIETNKN